MSLWSRRRVEQKLEEVSDAVQARRFSDAVARAEEVRSLAPDDPRGLAYLGWALHEAGDFVRAREALGGFVVRIGRGPLMRSPLGPAACGLLARTYYRLGRLHQARAWLDRAKRFESDDPEDLYLEALLTVAEGVDPIRARREAVARILEVDRTDPDFLDRRIAVLRQRLERPGPEVGAGV
jgi:tetratricopeptide (TPR) repeat protein